MASLYPGALDNLANPSATTTMNTSGALAHAAQHSNVNDAVDAIQVELGLNPKGTYGSVLARLADASYIGHTHTGAALGLAGTPVGTTDTQTLTSKTISGASNSLSNIPESAVTNLVTDLAAKAVVATVTTPSPLGVAAIGVATAAARADHVHLQPTLGTLGAAASVHTHIVADTTGLQTLLDAKALAATTITAGSGLTGGGSLAANRTFDVAWAGTGAAATAARSDHNHNATYAKVVALSTGTALPSVGSYSEGDMVVFY